jgi:hypothetical protein
MFMFRIPPADHAARQYLDDSIVETLDPKNFGRLPSLAHALSRGRQMVGTGAVRAVTYVCARADDDRILIRIGPKGGWKFLWNFGNGRA